ncbi:hypothetical protein ACFL0D_06915 [Thermoproteota archaeon]
MQPKVKTYPSELQFSKNRAGTFEAIRESYEYITLRASGLFPVDLQSWSIVELRKFLNNTRFDYKIYDDGSVYIRIPYGAKYGYVLGQLAHAYFYAQEAR